MSDRIVLVTGFAPFGDAKVNPSTDVARALDGMRIGDVRFVAYAPLPVVYDEAARVALAEATRVGADAILAVGLGGRTRHVRVEKRATNAASAPEPDNAGVHRRGVRAEESGPRARDTELDTDAIAARLRDAGIDCAPSTDAGGYVCNDLYYRLLAAAAKLDGPRHVVFVHVPADALELDALPRGLARAFAGAL